jgi:hypothetical protein
MSGPLHAPAALPSEKEPPVPIGWEVGWVSEPFWTPWCREKFPATTGNRRLVIFLNETLMLLLHIPKGTGDNFPRE